MPSSTNFLEWNPTEANQESDSTYLTDTQRLNGIAVDDIMPSARMNKMFRQWSVMCAALGQMLAINGYSTSDASTATLAATLQVLLDSTLPLITGIIVVPYSANPVFDCSLGWNFYMLLTGNVTAPTVIHATPGLPIEFQFQQDGVGGRTVAWPANVLGGGSVWPTANQYGIQRFRVCPDNNLRAVGPMMGA